MKDYVLSITKLAQEIGVNFDELRRKYQPREDFPAKTNRGWPVARCRDYIEASKLDQLNSTRGLHADLRREKLQLEIDLLRDKRDEARGVLVSRDDVKATIAELCAAFRHAAENGVQNVAANAQAAELVQMAEAFRDSVIVMAREHLHAD